MGLEGWLIRDVRDPEAFAVTIPDDDILAEDGAIPSLDSLGLDAGIPTGTAGSVQVLDRDVVIKQAIEDARTYMKRYFDSYLTAIGLFKRYAVPGAPPNDARAKSFLERLRDLSLSHIWTNYIKPLPVLGSLLEVGASVIQDVAGALQPVKVRPQPNFDDFVTDVETMINECRQESDKAFANMSASAAQRLLRHHDDLQDEKKQPYLQKLAKESFEFSQRNVPADPLEHGLYVLWLKLHEGYTAPGTGQNYTGTLDLTFEVPSQEWYEHNDARKVVFKEGVLRAPGAGKIVQRLPDIVGTHLKPIGIRFAITVRDGDVTTAFSIYEFKNGILTPEMAMALSGEFLHETKTYRDYFKDPTTGAWDLAQGLILFMIDWSKITGVEAVPA